MAIITGRLQHPDLTPYIGSVRFQLNDFGVDPRVLVLPNEVKADSDGYFSIDLWPNTRSLHATYYQCTLDNGTTFNISIPEEKSNYTLLEVILLDFGKIEPELSQIVQGNLVEVAKLQDYTGIENGFIPPEALDAIYPDTTVGKSLRVDQPLTIGDGLTGGEFIGDTPVTITVDDTVIRNTDYRLDNSREWTAPLVPLDVALEGTSEERMAWSPLRVQQTISAGVNKYGVTRVNSKTGPDVELIKDDIGLNNVPNIDTSNADNITSGTINSDRLQFGNTSNTVTEGNDFRLSNSREWIAPTAPDEVVGQPNNTTRFAWTPQRIWDAIKSWFSTITSDDLVEGTNNLYYTDNRVSSNLDVQANTNKVSADESVTTHRDVTDAGSGQIITSNERNKLNSLDPNAEPNSVNSVSGKTGDVELDKFDVGLSNVPDVDTSDAANITSGILSGDRLRYGTEPGTPAQGNDVRFSDPREWSANTVSQSEAKLGISSIRRAWTSQRVRENVANYTQPLTLSEKDKLNAFDSSKYLPIDGTAVNSELLNDVSIDKFFRKDQANILSTDTDIRGKFRLNGMSGTEFTGEGHLSSLDVISADPEGAAFMSFHRPGTFAVYFGLDKDNQLKVGGWALGDVAYKIWTSGNDGPGSGLNADLWNGKQFSSYIDQPLLTTSNPSFGSVYSSNWFRSTGNSGWYNETYKGGIHMSESTWIRTYNGKAFYSTSLDQAVSHTGAGALGCWGVRIGKGNICLNGHMYFGSTIRQMLNLYGTSYALGVQSSTLYFRSGSDFAFYVGGSHDNAARSAGGGYTVWSYIKSSDNIHFFKNANFSKSIKIANDSPTIQLLDNSVGRSMWLHNNNNRFYILSDNDNDNAWEGPYPAVWDDSTQKAYFWEKQVLTIDTGIRKDIEDTLAIHTRWADNQHVRLGSAADYRIYHDGSNTIHDNYTGNIYYRQYAHGKNLYFTGEDSSGVNRALIYMHPNSSVNLFYKGSEKFRTENYGVRITSSITLYHPTTTYIDFNNNESADFNARISCTNGTSKLADGNLELTAKDITLKLEPTSNNGLVFIDSKSSPNMWAFSSFSDGNFYIQQRNPDKTFDANIIRFGKSEIRHYAPLVSSSSIEVKDVQGRVSNGLDLVNKLNPVVYNYKGQSNTEVGLIAEEVPNESHLVYGEGSDSGIDYSKLTIYLIDAVQKLTKRIEKLEKG